MLWSYENTFCTQRKKNNNFIQQFVSSIGFCTLSPHAFFDSTVMLWSYENTFCTQRKKQQLYSTICLLYRSLHTVRFSVFSYSPSFPIKMHATDAKTQKIEPDPIFFWRTKVSEAVCKRDWHNMRSYLFFNMRKFQTFRPYVSVAPFWRISAGHKLRRLFRVSHTTRITLLHLFMLWFEWKQRILVARLTQKSVRSLRPADILQNGATLTQRRQIVE